jgi:hypothetical protein
LISHQQLVLPRLSFADRWLGIQATTNVTQHQRITNMPEFGISETHHWTILGSIMHNKQPTILPLLLLLLSISIIIIVVIIVILLSIHFIPLLLLFYV